MHCCHQCLSPVKIWLQLLRIRARFLWYTPDLNVYTIDKNLGQSTISGNLQTRVFYFTTKNFAKSKNNRRDHFPGMLLKQRLQYFLNNLKNEHHSRIIRNNSGIYSILKKLFEYSKIWNYSNNSRITLFE